MRNPRDFGKPLAVGAPDPLLEIPVQPSRMIHFFDFSNEKMVGEGPRHRQAGGHPARQPRGRGPRRPQGGRARGPREGRPRDRTSATRSCGRASTPRQPVGPRRPDDARRRDRRQARRDHGPEGRGRLGHPLRRPPARPAGGASTASRSRSSCTRSSRRRSASRTSRRSPPPRPRMQGMSFGPADLAASRRMKTTRVGGGHPGYRVIEDPDPDNPEAPRAERPAGPLALLDRAHGRRLRRDRDPPLLRPVRRHRRRRRLRGAVPRRLPDGLRRRLVAAPGADRRSPRRSSRPTPTRSSSPSG